MRIFRLIVWQIVSNRLGHGRHEIDLRHKSIGNRIGLGRARPANEEGYVVTSFVNVSLQAAKGTSRPVIELPIAFVSVLLRPIIR